MALSTKARLSFPHSQFLPSGNLHKPLILIHQRTDRSKTIIPQSPEWKPQSQKANQNDHMDHSHLELNEAMSHAMQGHPNGWVIVESSDTTWFTREGNANHSSVLASRMPWTIWKGKKMWHQKMIPPGEKVSNILLEMSIEIVPERMKRLGQSRKDSQL